MLHRIYKSTRAPFRLRKLARWVKVQLCRCCAEPGGCGCLADCYCWCHP